jgi:hypothetical protein
MDKLEIQTESDALFNLACDLLNEDERKVIYKEFIEGKSIEEWDIPSMYYRILLLITPNSTLLENYSDFIIGSFAFQMKETDNLGSREIAKQLNTSHTTINESIKSFKLIHRWITYYDKYIALTKAVNEYLKAQKEVTGG